MPRTRRIELTRCAVQVLFCPVCKPIRDQRLTRVSPRWAGVEGTHLPCPDCRGTMRARDVLRSNQRWRSALLLGTAVAYRASPARPGTVHTARAADRAATPSGGPTPAPAPCC